MMPDAVSLGPLALPPRLAIWGAALVVTFLVAAVYKRTRPAKAEAIDLLIDTASAALLIAFLVWKLTPLVTWWEVIAAEPSRLLRMPGGRPGVIVGAIAAAGYSIIQLRRRSPVTARELARISLPLAVTLAATATIATAALYITTPASGVRLANTAAPHDVVTEGSEPAAVSGRNTLPAQLLTATAPLLTSLDSPAERTIAYSGQTTVITFWATWCGPCHAELPIKAAFYKEYGESVSFVSVNLTATEGSIATVQQYVSENEIDWPVFLDQQGRLARLFGVRGTPTTIVIGSEGQLLGRWMGPSSLDRLERAALR
jgi:thiol-disulfide isomerase/thioredoxin